MPTYEYVCAKCDHQFDITQRITDRPLTICPRQFCGQKKWGKGKVTRAIGTGGGLIFKGSGFYITDYRSDKYKEAAKKDSAPVTAPSADSKASGDSKPAKKESKSEGKAAKPPTPKTSPQ